MNKILAPFDELQVKSINLFQYRSAFNPYKCKKDKTVLQAEKVGLVCSACGSKSNWVWDWVANFEWIRLSIRVIEFMNGDHDAYKD